MGSPELGRIVAGVDLAVRGRTGLALVDPRSRRVVWAGLLHGGAEPAARLLLGRRDSLGVVAVDAPQRGSGKGLRCEERLLARCTGVGLLPGGLPGMRMLVREARRLAALLPSGTVLVETFPGAAARVLRVPRPGGAARHIVDAVLAALAGLALLEGWAVGACCGDHCIYIPAPVPGARGLAGRLAAEALDLAGLDY